MKNNKKIIAVLCAGCVAVGLLAGCTGTGADVAEAADTGEVQAQETEAGADATEEAAQSDALVIQVESVDGNTVTGVSGTLQTMEMGSPPDGAQGEESDGTGGGTPPEMPEDGTMPERPEGGEDMPEMSGDGTRPEMPEGMDGAEMPDGEASGEMGGGPGGNFSGGSQFVAGDETISFELTDATVVTQEFLEGTQEGDASAIVTGAVLEVELNDNNEATAVTVKNLSAGGGFGGSGEVTQGTAANTITEDGSYEGETYTSGGDDENALRAGDA